MVFVKKNRVVIATHDDADGIASAVMLAKALRADGVSEIEVVFPEVFGDVDDSVDYCLDMRPLRPDYSGTVIDHHPGHSDERKYRLYWDSVPTGVIVYRYCRGLLPKTDRWIVAVSCVGDGQPESIPSEIWDEFPELLDKIVFGDLVIEKYRLLSSGVNSMARIGECKRAFEILYNAKGIDDLIWNDELDNARRKVADELERVRYRCKPIVIGRFMVAEIDSPFKIESRLATELHEKYGNYTVVVYNRRSGNGSIRGVHALYLVDKLNSVGIQAGGHAGYAGFRTDKFDDVVRVIRGCNLP